MCDCVCVVCARVIVCLRARVRVSVRTCLCGRPRARLGEICTTQRACTAWQLQADEASAAATCDRILAGGKPGSAAGAPLACVVVSRLLQCDSAKQTLFIWPATFASVLRSALPVVQQTAAVALGCIGEATMVAKVRGWRQRFPRRGAGTPSRRRIALTRCGRGYGRVRAFYCRSGRRCKS